jgi:hypothetical protein
VLLTGAIQSVLIALITGSLLGALRAEPAIWQHHRVEEKGKHMAPFASADYCTLNEVATRYRVQPLTVHRWIKNWVLPFPGDSGQTEHQG